MSAGTWPGKLGGRFSRKLITPSRASPPAPSSSTNAESSRWASIGWAAPSIRQSSARVSATDTPEVVSTTSRAMA